MQRQVLLFSGHVQGVGFRFTARQIAAGFAVRGYVRNLNDGRVELVAEGDAGDIELFVRQVESRMNGYVEQVDRQVLAATGEFVQFEIRR